jgi:hypothetical protein
LLIGVMEEAYVSNCTGYLRNHEGGAVDTIHVAVPIVGAASCLYKTREESGLGGVAEEFFLS